MLSQWIQYYIPRIAVWKGISKKVIKTIIKAQVRKHDNHNILEKIGLSVTSKDISNLPQKQFNTDVDHEIFRLICSQSDPFLFVPRTPLVHRYRPKVSLDHFFGCCVQDESA